MVYVSTAERTGTARCYAKKKKKTEEKSNEEKSVFNDDPGRMYGFRETEQK